MAVTAIFNQLLQKTPLNWTVSIGPLADVTQILPLYVTPSVGFISIGLRRPSCVQPAPKISYFFNDTPVMLLPYLFCHVLAMRKALKPLTQLLQERKIKYQWRFPFHLRVHHESKTALFCTL